MAGLYIEVSETLAKHPKTIRVARSLRIHPGMVVYHLINLWSWALKNAPNGDVTKYSDRDLADAAEWTDAMDYLEEADEKATRFVTALKECRISDDGHGFLEVVSGKVLIHDWFEFGGKVMANRWRDNFRKKFSRYPTEEESQSAGFPGCFGKDFTPSETNSVETSRNSTESPRNSEPVPSVSNVTKRSEAKRSGAEQSKAAPPTSSAAAAPRPGKIDSEAVLAQNPHWREELARRLDTPGVRNKTGLTQTLLAQWLSGQETPSPPPKMPPLPEGVLEQLGCDEESARFYLRQSLGNLKQRGVIGQFDSSQHLDLVLAEAKLMRGGIGGREPS